MCRGDEVKLLSLGGKVASCSLLRGWGSVVASARSFILCPGHEVGGTACVVWVGLCWISVIVGGARYATSDLSVYT